MVSISDEYKFKRLVKTLLNRVGSLSSLKFTTRVIKIPGFRAGFSFQPGSVVSIE